MAEAPSERVLELIRKLDGVVLTCDRCGRFFAATRREIEREASRGRKIRLCTWCYGVARSNGDVWSKV